MHKGSCLCGGVRYELNGPLGPMVCCHCPDCRKAQGSAFATVAPVASADFRLLSGEDLLCEYESSPGKWRVFCRRCGSPIFSRRDADPAVLRLRVGSLDTPVSGPVSGHIWVSTKAPWHDIGGKAPQYETFEPTRKPGSSGEVGKK